MQIIVARAALVFVVAFTATTSSPRTDAAVQADDAAESAGPSVAAYGFGFAEIDPLWKPQAVDAEHPDADGSITLVLDHPLNVRASVRAELAVVGKGADDVVRERLVAIDGVATYREVAAVTRAVGSRKLPGLRVVQKDATGVDYRVRQFFVVEHDLLYTLQEIALASSGDASERVFGPLWSKLTFTAPDAAVTAAATLRVLAARCGSELAWANDWNDAARRARAEHKPILVLVRAYSGLPDTEVATAGAWMDEDVVALVRDRFVPLVLTPDMEAPFRDPQIYGTSPTTFGNSVLVAKPDGQIVGDTFVADPFSLFDFLCVYAPDAAPVVAKTASPRARADALRKLRDADGALAALEAASAAAHDDAERAALDVDTAVVMLRLGRNAEADALLDGALVETLAPAVEARALFFRGASAAQGGDHARALAAWERLVRDDADSRWAWFAAAERGGLIFKLGGGSSLRWPLADVLATVRDPPRATLARSRVRDAEHDGLEFLLATQRENGSWPNPSELESGSEGPNAFIDAGTAIAGLALLAHRDDPRARKAVDAALEFVLAQQPEWPLEPSALYFMDYTPWRHAYVLQFLVACKVAGIGDAQRIKPELDGLVARLARLQSTGGGWTYLLTSKLGGAATESAAEPSISFVTAAVVHALLDAREQGVDVPEKTMTRALDVLESLQGGNGAFVYMVDGAATGKHPDEAMPGASGRGPLCAYALLRGGRRKAQDLRAAVDAFVTHGTLLAREQGKSLMHCGPDGQGSHYLYFDYANTALALRALPKSDRSPCRDRVLDYVLAGRLADGSFDDNPLIGRTCATGFALIAFEALR